MSDKKPSSQFHRLSKDELNKVVGGAGYNLYGEGGNDLLVGLDGNDVLRGGGGDDVLYAGGGNDVLRGDAGNDRLYGGDGNDNLDGGAGNDTLYGGNGNDVISMYPGEGADTATGGDGTDTLRLVAAPDAYRIEFTSGGLDPNGDGQQLLPNSAGTVHFTAGGSVTFSQFERITHQ